MSILRSGVCRDTGYAVEEQRFDKPLNFMPATFWVCRPPDRHPTAIGTGRTKQEAVAAMLTRNPELPAVHPMFLEKEAA